MPSRKRKPLKSHSRLNPFLRGVIYGLHLAGLTLTDIADEIVKEDGASVLAGRFYSVLVTGRCWIRVR